jgi:hypothetical protein
MFFQLELMDRDDLPVDVSLFRDVAGTLAEFTECRDPVAAPHEVQALPGNKLAPRILKENGVYYVRVAPIIRSISCAHGSTRSLRMPTPNEAVHRRGLHHGCG